MRIVLVIVIAFGICHAQATATSSLRFEVASVKPSPVPPVNHAYTINETRIDLGATSLKYLIQLAYNVEAFQVAGPDWLATTRVDILAKPPAGATKDQIPEMFQALLADRLGLALHREPREQQVYALQPGKGGPKLKDAAPDNQVDVAFMNGRAILSKFDTPEGDGYWAVSYEKSNPGGGQSFDGPRITMAEFARMLMPYVEFPVVDMTGLRGPFHVRLDVPRTLAAEQRRASLGVPAPSAASDPEGGLTIFSSVQKLGLVLEKRKAPVETLVIDHIEKVPTEN